MYDLKDIKTIHLEITTKCQAKCPMCPRRIDGGPLNPFMDLEEITLEQFKEWFPVSFLEQIEHISMCGNYGDPIVASDTLDIIKYIKSVRPTMSIFMNTNGSARNKEWWTELASLNVEAIFGIDGLADTHHLYRINTDWNKIIENAKTFIAAGGKARWDMILFKHNEHQVEACRQLSIELGFQEFIPKHTGRFKHGRLDVLDETGRSLHTLYPTTKSTTIQETVIIAQKKTKPVITCKAVQYSQIYVGANGNVTPCCWLDNQAVITHHPGRVDYMNKINDRPNLKTNTLAEIFDSGYFSKISKCWSTTGLYECTKQCGDFDKFGAQFE